MTVDAYGDLDQPSEWHTPPPGAPWRTASAARLARSIQADAVVYQSNIDNDPRVVGSLAAGRRLWGNPPEVLRRARNPVTACDAFRAAGIDAPDVLVDGKQPHVGDWMVKPLRSGGGARVRRWRGRGLPRGQYAQQYVHGQPGSVVFVAAGGRASVFGTTRQLVGDAAFGASGFRYCGSLLCQPQEPSMRAQASEIAHAAAAFGLVGVGGVDFIDDGRVMHPIEVNPRWTASMELVERAGGLSVFGAHVEACVRGALPSVADPPRAAPVQGKAIVFARDEITVSDTREWLTDATVRDIPRPGTRIAAGQPVCTVLAHGADAAACYRALVGRADAVYVQLAQWARAAA